jgi:hypothetical protein
MKKHSVTGLWSRVGFEGCKEYIMTISLTEAEVQKPGQRVTDSSHVSGNTFYGKPIIDRV